MKFLEGMKSLYQIWVSRKALAELCYVIPIQFHFLVQEVVDVHLLK